VAPDLGHQPAEPGIACAQVVDPELYLVGAALREMRIGASKTLRSSTFAERGDVADPWARPHPACAVPAEDRPRLLSGLHPGSPNSGHTGGWVPRGPEGRAQ
jgi:hypothetical protein